MSIEFAQPARPSEDFYESNVREHDGEIISAEDADHFEQLQAVESALKLIDSDSDTDTEAEARDKQVEAAYNRAQDERDRRKDQGVDVVIPYDVEKAYNALLARRSNKANREGADVALQAAHEARIDQANQISDPVEREKKLEDIQINWTLLQNRRAEDHKRFEE